MNLAVAVIAAGDDLTRIVDAHGLVENQTGVIDMTVLGRSFVRLCEKGLETKSPRL
jgi:hypothetical protein